MDRYQDQPHLLDPHLGTLQTLLQMLLFADKMKSLFT